MNDLLQDHRISGALPGWVIERAATYMLRRYGSAATVRALARHRTLLDEGRQEAAADWLRVTEEIERVRAAQVRPLRRRTPAQNGVL
jgi:hypothetical protein